MLVAKVLSTHMYIYNITDQKIVDKNLQSNFVNWNLKYIFVKIKLKEMV